ncbi:MAG: LamG domain-containing protein [Planctomycetota bacterium]|nr:MAG: LamG domain-containing protein [Planctomycetota bacterium]REK30708.1 MAG: LamG domain-containing protein [Planctomycetota bacterium]REK33083.1 MAG: LamG domain-containing protein [Planctomycetota bacterium]
MSSSSTLSAQDELKPHMVGHWTLTENADDSSGSNLAGRDKDLAYTREGAVFDGQTSRLDVNDDDRLNFGDGEFSIAAWVHTDSELDDAIGDLLNKYDPAARRGFNLSIKHHAGVTGSQSNYRHLEFGIDDGKQEDEWRDEGRPGNSIFVHSMTVHDGDLYVGTVEGWTNNDHGHVYRYDGTGEWQDLGAPWKSNGVTSMASYDGHLYVGVSRVLLHYSGLEPTIAHHIGGKVFRYEDGEWVDLGQLLGVDGVNGMAIFRGQLYVTGFYQPALFRYEGGTEWTSLGSPDGMRPEALCVYNGAMYATGYDEGAVYRFDGESWSHTGILGDATQVYGLVIYEGQLHAGTWPKGTVYRYEGEDGWISTGRLGNAEEVMGPNVYNGKLYAGTLPMAEIYRYDGDEQWKSVGRVDFTPDVIYRRAWSMAVYQGRLFSGTLPSGHVRSFEAGVNVTYDHEFPSGWHHIVAVRDADRLRLYVDGEPVAASREFKAEQFDLSNDAPLRIGSGPHDHLRGKLKDLRLYRGALSADEIRELAKSR